MSEKEYIERGALIEFVKQNTPHIDGDTTMQCVERAMKAAPAADVVEVEKVAEMLRAMFDDDSACNYNGNDEWLPLVCEFSDECPMPKERLGCWKQFVKHFLAKMGSERKENP